MPKPTKYDSIRKSLRTGDVILFSGKGGISAGIKWATMSRWSHVGMILVLPEYNFVCVWESTTLGSVKDLESGSARKGVQLVPLSARVNKYKGEIALRQLKEVEFAAPEVQDLMVLRKHISRRPYEKSKLELIKAAYDGPFGGNEEDLSSLFCSELVAEAYQTLGLVKGDKKAKPSNEYTPADFSESDEDIPWIRGRLGKEIMLKN